MPNPFVGKVCVPKIGFRGKPTFQKEKNRYLKKIDSDKNFRGQFSVRNFRSYFINYSARENFIRKNSKVLAHQDMQFACVGFIVTTA